MSKPNTPHRFALKKKSLGIAFAILLVGLMLMYLGRGWLRVTVIPWYVDVMHRQSVQNAFDEVNEELGHPLTALELNVSNVRGNNAQCSENTAQHFHVEVGCSAFIGGQGKVIDEAYRQKHTANLENLENKLIQDSWHKSQSTETPPTFKDLLSSQKTGYIGYVRYDKKVQGVNCWISISRFKELAGVLSCGRTSVVGFNP